MYFKHFGYELFCFWHLIQPNHGKWKIFIETTKQNLDLCRRAPIFYTSTRRYRCFFSEATLLSIVEDEHISQYERWSHVRWNYDYLLKIRIIHFSRFIVLILTQIQIFSYHLLFRARCCLIAFWQTKSLVTYSRNFTARNFKARYICMCY